ncbi:MAG: SMP-30/gluconolactonase/LRE family protein [Chloroflexota bacterium]|nr:SMP-30/gluconolactonase/LRE family protein [Chloroflexota bacterium]
MAQPANPPGGSGPATPPSTTTNPPRDFTAPSVYFTDPDVLQVDPAFGDLIQGNASIMRLWNGPVNGKPILWAEGPAWSSQGRYLLWSDIPNNRQLRWLDDDGHVTVFREPSGISNGNTFDFSGRQISFEHLNRRVVRYEHDGAVSILAEGWQGKRLNSPNDGQVHADGSVWFTDPPYGEQLYEGDVDVEGGPSNPTGRINARAGQPAGFPMFKRELPTQVYRVDPNGTLDAVVRNDAIPNPNGFCFSPDFKHIYVASTGGAPPSGMGEVWTGDVGEDNKSVSNLRILIDPVIDGIRCGTDGLRCDIQGNIWASSNAGRNVGYSGVTVWSPAGNLLGRIRIPEVVGNITFGGPKRNRLFMAASTSLYALYVGTQGAGPA